MLVLGFCCSSSPLSLFSLTSPLRMVSDASVDVGLHVGKVRKDLVDLSEVGVAVEGMDIIGSERDRSGIGSGEGHVNMFTMVGVTS